MSGIKIHTNLLKEIREEKGLTVYRVAKDLGIQRRTLSAWESGEHDPRLHDVIMLADYYDVSLEYIAMRDPYKSYETRSICETTGLSEKSAQLFIDYKKRHESVKAWEENLTQEASLHMKTRLDIEKRYAHVPHYLLDVIEALLSSCYLESDSNNIFDLIYKYVTNVSLENVDIVYNKIMKTHYIERNSIANIRPDIYDQVYLDVNQDPFNSHKLSDLVEEAQVRSILNKLSEIRKEHLKRGGK